MRCPKCGSRDDKVIDSRQSRDSSSIRRRRECLKCKYRFTTYEEIERSDLRVVKRDRTHEPFDRRKLAASIAKAFEKRSTSLLTLEDTVDEIVHELETSGREVPSSVIGAKVLEKLRGIDEVAYLALRLSVSAVSGRRSICGCHSYSRAPHKTECAPAGIVSI